MGAALYCPSCGTVGTPRTHNRGSSAVEIFLWLCFLVPGFFYTLWRMGRIDRFCRVCRAPNPIPLTSPLAQRALGMSTAGQVGSQPVTSSTSALPKVATVQNTSREIGWKLALGIIVAPYVFGWALIRPGYSNVARAITTAWGLFMVVPMVAGYMIADKNNSAPTPTVSAPRLRTAAVPAATQAAHNDDNPLAGVRQWDSYLDGNKIACYESNIQRWYIVIPTPEQKEDGEVMVVNKNPSDDAWNSACSKQPVMGHW